MCLSNEDGKMKMFITRNLNFTIFILLKYGYLCSSVNPGEVHLSRKFIGNMFKTLAGTSLSMCADICQQKVNCKSVNYNRQQKICELNSDSEIDSEFLQLAAGWLFSESDKWSVEKTSQCKLIPCQQNETCIKIGDSLECKIEECEASFNFDSATVLGNMNNVGSVLASEYDNGYGLSYFVCDDNGQWTYLKEADSDLICQDPPSVITGLEIKEASIKTYEGLKIIAATNDSYISSLVVKQGSTITYRCTNASYLIGNPTSICSSGQWSVSSISCIDKCPKFKSFNYGLHKCVSLTSCINGYADTFQKHEGTVMWLRDYDNIKSSEEQGCIDACRSDLKCNSFDFNKLLGKCYLQQLKTFDMSIILYLPGWTYYQRDCN